MSNPCARERWVQTREVSDEYIVMMVEDIAVHQWCHQFQHDQWVWLLLPLLPLQRHLNPVDQWATIILQNHVDNSFVQGAGEFRPQRA